MNIVGFVSSKTETRILKEGAVIIDKAAVSRFDDYLRTMLGERDKGKVIDGDLIFAVREEPFMWQTYGRAPDEDEPSCFEALEIRMNRDEAVAVLELSGQFLSEVALMADGDWDMHLHFRDEYDQWDED